ncbi:MAG: phosphate ABC transporter substrate-binding protein PstS [Acidimicrobiales bacterium]|nr:MAG: phosphate ABC transporter substrate-binding protein PstS [Acidimicrobiales bacterium]
MPSTTRLIAPAALLVTAGLALAACGSKSSTSTTTSSASGAAASAPGATDQAPATTVSLTETGSSLLFPLFSAWAPAYTKEHPNITITPASTGSGAGIAGATAGTADIGSSDAYLAPAQQQMTPSLVNIPLAISAQQVNYNLPGAPAHLKLNGKVLAEMYLGKITTWNDAQISALNPGASLPSTKVVPVHRSDGSGDTFLFSSFLSKSDPTDWTISPGTTVAFPPVPGNLGATGNGGMVTTCGSTPGCVAYIGVSFQDKATMAGLGEAMLANSSGRYLLPTADAVSAEAASFAGQTPANESISLIYGSPAAGYPIVNYEYAIVNTTQSNSNKAQAIRAFLDWTINPANGNSASFLGPVHFVPLPARVVSLSQAQVAKIGKA